VETLIWGMVPVAMILLGIYMAFWPAHAAVMNRDDNEDTSAPSASERWRTCVLGVVLFVGGVYFLYRMFGGSWGA
jgi:hypothetical protein